mgnify:CR=1 FL=1
MEILDKKSTEINSFFTGLDELLDTIQLHDNRTGSPQLAELVLRMLAQEGYEVVRVDKLLNIHAYDNEN